MRCRRCDSELIDGKCPNCYKIDRIKSESINSNKKKGSTKLIIIFIVVIAIISLSIGGFYIYKKIEKKNNNELLEIKRNEIIAILNKEPIFTNASKILDEIPSDDLDDLVEEEIAPKIDLSFSKEVISIDEEDKSKGVFSIKNKTLNEIIEVNAELVNFNDTGLVLKGSIKNISSGFNFPKLTLRVLSYSKNLSNISSLQHNKYYLLEDLYTFDLKEGESKEFIMRIRDKNTQFLKIGLKTGNLFLHSEENAESINNDISIPVITTDKYNAEENYLPFRYALIDTEGNVDKIYEHKKLIKEYPKKNINNEKDKEDVE